MGAYIGVMLCLTLFYSGLRRVEMPLQRKVRTYAVTASFLLVLLLGLRHPSMGIDLGYGRSYGYLPSFAQISAMPWRAALGGQAFQNYEQGYVLLNKLLMVLGLGEQGLLLACGALSVLPIGWMIGRYSANCRTSFLIYLGLPAFFICFSGLRQGIALGISFFAYRFAIEKRWKAYLGTILLACLFHSTAIIALLIYPALRVFPDRWARWVSLAGLGMLFVFRSELWNVIVRVTGRSIPAVHNGSIELMLLFCGIYLYMLLFSQGERHLEGLINVQYLACGALIFAEVSQVAQRVGYYFMLYLTLSLPEILRGIRRKRGELEYALHTFAVVGGFLLFGVYQLRTNTWAMAWPYRFFWE